MIKFFSEISDAGIDLPCVSIMPKFLTNRTEVAISVEIEGTGDKIAKGWASGSTTSHEDTVLRFRSISSIHVNQVDISVVNDDMRCSILRRRMLAGAP